MRNRPITEEEHARVTAAIRSAEADTAGEIYCIVAKKSGSYFPHAALSALCGILLMSLLAALVADALWIAVRPTLLVGAQLAATAITLLSLWLWPALPIRFVPAPLRHARAHDHAVRQFLARNVHQTAARTGVLLFVSLEERYAEVLADSGIAAHVPQSAWDEAVGHLTRHAGDGRIADGFVEAIGLVGALLAKHFPRPPGDRNELDDHLVEL